MKKGIIILLGMFMMVSTIEAKSGKLPINKKESKHRYNDAISFIERGIKFHVFLNGDFDFNSKHENTYYDYNGRRTRNHGIQIEKDRYGKIRRVGNVFVNYDYRGNVKRIGNVFMNYRHGSLTNVGNLKISYNRWGDPSFYGHVKNNHYYTNDLDVNINLNFGDVCEYNDVYFYRNDFRNNYFKVKEDNNFYYYKARPNAKIGKRSKVLKRRKISKRTPKRRGVQKSTKYRKKESKKKTVRKRRV